MSATLKRLAKQIENEAIQATCVGQHDRLMAIATEVREEAQRRDAEIKSYANLLAKHRTLTENKQ